MDINESDLNLDVFKNKRIIIFGGTTCWVNKMREKLPQAIFISLNSKNPKLNFIDQYGYIFINTNINQNFYYKIKSITNKMNVNYYYIKNYDNINYSLKEMIDVVKNTNK